MDEKKIKNLLIEKYKQYFDFWSWDKVGSECYYEIMQVLARWYDIEVVFEDDGLRRLEFSGNLDKYTDIDSFFRLFELGAEVRSSVITIVGFKMANKPADKNHPYGHGRIGYISALIISFLVLLVGFQFVKTSIGRILNPEPVTFDWLSFIL